MPSMKRQVLIAHLFGQLLFFDKMKRKKLLVSLLGILTTTYGHAEPFYFAYNCKISNDRVTSPVVTYLVDGTFRKSPEAKALHTRPAYRTDYSVSIERVLKTNPPHIQIVLWQPPNDFIKEETPSANFFFKEGDDSAKFVSRETKISVTCEKDPAHVAFYEQKVQSERAALKDRGGVYDKKRRSVVPTALAAQCRQSRSLKKA